MDDQVDDPSLQQIFARTVTGLVVYNAGEGAWAVECGVLCATSGQE
jgi:hypothetical protein